MIIEFALSLSLTLPNPTPDAGLPLVQAQFSEPVQEVITYDGPGILNQVLPMELPGGTSEAFEGDFQNGQVYFGAFAITKDFGYGYVTGANSLQAARDVAMQECLKQGPVCVIYAEIMPQGYVPLQPGQVSLAPEPAGHYRNPDPSWGNFRAMAISEDGAYSVVWNYGSPAEAAAAAMSDCTGYIVNDLPNLRPMPCVLIPFK